MSRQGIASVAAAEAAKAEASAIESVGDSKASAILWEGIMDSIGTVGSAGIDKYGENR